MSSSNAPYEDEEARDEEAAMLDPDEAAEEIPEDMDAAMDSDGENGDDDGDEMREGDMIQEEIELQNDSSAHFDSFKDSIFCIAQHPLLSNIIAVGGSEGEDAGGIGYIFDSTPAPSPVLPASYNAAPHEPTERKSLEPILTLEGHTDSINAVVFTEPKGEYLVTGGLDGRLRAYASRSALDWRFLAEAQEVEEINWLCACPNAEYPNTFALGANDGSVWVYTVDAGAKDDSLHILQTYFLHTAPSTAGAWTPDGKLLATVSEDSSLYVWDVFGEASAAGVLQGTNGQAVVGLTALDQRFAVEGGLYSVACSPTGPFLAVGGAGGAVKIVGLPRLSPEHNKTPGSSKGKAGKAAKGGSSSAAAAAATTSQAGQILADLNTQTDGIETLAFAPAPATLLAAGSVDGSIALYDSAYRFAARRHIKEAHEQFSVVRVAFADRLSSSGALVLTSAGMDGVVRRWDCRGGTAMANSGLMGEWRGHRGDGEGGGVLGFVQGRDGRRIVTAGDDSVALVFDAPY
ncbi:MAG: hypothetical protein M1818_003246 [Claussenomyces sp. TS43310]|nr:MAG: hypothetical protein M1818_003246 [Claussenomyces sp. TS43310]